MSYLTLLDFVLGSLSFVLCILFLVNENSNRTSFAQKVLRSIQGSA